MRACIFCTPRACVREGSDASAQLSSYYCRFLKVASWYVDEGLSPRIRLLLVYIERSSFNTDENARPLRRVLLCPPCSNFSRHECSREITHAHASLLAYGRVPLRPRRRHHQQPRHGHHPVQRPVLARTNHLSRTPGPPNHP